MAALRDVIGDTTAFLDAVFEGLRVQGVDVSHYLLDHICYRVASQELYELKKAQLSKLGVILCEANIGGRPIATFRLVDPIRYGHRRIPMVELPSPKASSPYPNGLEHAEFVVSEPLEAFVKRYPKLAWDTSAMGKARNADVSIKLSDEPRRSVKFHRQSLDSVIAEEKGETALPRAGTKRDAGSSSAAPAPTNKEDVHAFRSGLVAAAHHIVYERMPAKVVYLHALFTVRVVLTPCDRISRWSYRATTRSTFSHRASTVISRRRSPTASVRALMRRRCSPATRRSLTC